MVSFVVMYLVVRLKQGSSVVIGQFPSVRSYCSIRWLYYVLRWGKVEDCAHRVELCYRSGGNNTFDSSVVSNILQEFEIFCTSLSI